VQGRYLAEGYWVFVLSVIASSHKKYVPSFLQTRKLAKIQVFLLGHPNSSQNLRQLEATLPLAGHYQLPHLPLTLNIMSPKTRAMSRAAFNSIGLAALPNEIYYEILSNVPAVQILVDTDEDDASVDHDRRFTLSALSQTCRSLRQFFLPHLWERIELYKGMRIDGGVAFSTVKGELLIKELARQLETPTMRNTDLAQHVRCVSVF